MREIPLPDIPVDRAFAYFDRQKEGSSGEDFFYGAKEQKGGEKGWYQDVHQLQEYSMRQAGVVARLENENVKSSRLPKEGARLNHILGHTIYLLLSENGGEERVQQLQEKVRETWEKYCSPVEFDAKWIGAVGEAAARRAIMEAGVAMQVPVEFESPRDSIQFDTMIERDALYQVDFRTKVGGKLVDFQVKTKSDKSARQENLEVREGGAKMGDSSTYGMRGYKKLAAYINYRGDNTELFNLDTGKPSPYMVGQMMGAFTNKLGIKKPPIH